MYHYQAYGLIFAVPFECPSMMTAPNGAQADISVHEGPVPCYLSDPIVTEPMFDASARQFLVRGGMRAARFLVTDGKHVTYAPNPHAEGQMLEARFTTMVLPAVLRQRALLVLHATSTVTEHGALAIAGHSGAGKSTTMAGLLADGARMLSDDVTALQLNDDRVVQALPGVAELHLTEASTTGLAVDVTGLLPQPWRRMKTAVPVTDRMAGEPTALTAVYVLSISDGDGQVRTEEQFGSAKFAALNDCLYGPVSVHEGSAMFALFRAVLEQTAIIRVTRPSGTWSVDAVRDAIWQRERAGTT
ncbi:hypothetical protein [uncultured Jatrophihabitans sp.]|uniref:hypothetical protein n=1 Tax=uncultured Jatrophihabitans sp. TaxID=1610747 RepID=UPI0035CA8F14